MVIEHTRELGPLAPGLDPGNATDILWILNDPAHYDALVLQRDWPERTFSRWLAHTMRTALLPTR